MFSRVNAIVTIFFNKAYVHLNLHCNVIKFYPSFLYTELHLKLMKKSSQCNYVEVTIQHSCQGSGTMLHIQPGGIKNVGR